jgi:hypothetical protein
MVSALVTSSWEATPPASRRRARSKLAWALATVVFDTCSSDESAA